MSLAKMISMPLLGLVIAMCLFSTSIFTAAYPSAHLLDCRDEPDFPEQPPSCAICSTNYDGISSCAQAAPVLANFTSIIFNPGAFVDVVKCACTDTFQSAYPQCVDCFEKTNQTSFLNADTQDLPSILKGVNSICGLASTLFGNVSDTDGESTPSSAIAASTPSATSANGGDPLAIASPYTLVITVGFMFTALFVI